MLDELRAEAREAGTTAYAIFREALGRELAWRARRRNGEAAKCADRGDSRPVIVRCGRALLRRGLHLRLRSSSGRGAKASLAWEPFGELLNRGASRGGLQSLGHDIYPRGTRECGAKSYMRFSDH